MTRLAKKKTEEKSNRIIKVYLLSAYFDYRFFVRGTIKACEIPSKTKIISTSAVVMLSFPSLRKNELM